VDFVAGVEFGAVLRLAAIAYVPSVFGLAACAGSRMPERAS
jgi:hypothetical protein